MTTGEMKRSNETASSMKCSHLYGILLLLLLLLLFFIIIIFKLDDCIAHATKSRSRNYQSPINPGKHQHYACGINDYTRILSGLLTQTGALMC